MKSVNLKESTKINWTVQLNGDSNYPGDENIKLGCLMRIADATEKMAQNYTKLQDELSLYKKWYKERGDTIEYLRRQNRALRGHLTRLKNKHNS